MKISRLFLIGAQARADVIEQTDRQSNPFRVRHIVLAVR